MEPMVLMVNRTALFQDRIDLLYRKVPLQTITQIQLVAANLMKKPIMKIINRILHLQTIFVLVPRNKSGHMNNLHCFEKPINFLVAPLIVSVCLLQKFHSPYIRNYNR